MSGAQWYLASGKAGVMGVFEWLRRELTPQQNYPTQYGQRPSGIVVPQLSRPLQNGQSALGAAASAPTYFGAHNGPSVGPDGWFMPTYSGRDICDWGSDISALKRSGDLSRALVIARGCMDAMIAAARLNPVNVAEYYVTQVAIIQHKQKDYSGEVETIERWLALGLPAPREDFRLELRKRLAKAHEMLAKQRGEDSSQYNAQWKHFVELEKAAKAVQKGSAPMSATGRSAASPDVSYARPKSRQRSSWVVPTEVLALPSFVAVDFETANRQGGESACQIALVKVSGGRVVERACTLIKPPPGFDRFEFTYLHGISARDVRRSPMWPDIAAWVAGFHAGLPVYAHNAAFDARVWRELDAFFGTRTLPQSFFCSYRTAQHMVPGLENYKLPTVTKALVPGFKLNHHRADSDAEACALVVAALQSRR